MMLVKAYQSRDSNNTQKKSDKHLTEVICLSPKERRFNVVSTGFEPVKIPKNRLIYHKPHLSRLASFLWYPTNKSFKINIVASTRFELVKIPKNQLIYHKPHLSRSCPLPLVRCK